MLDKNAYFMGFRVKQLNNLMLRTQLFNRYTQKPVVYIVHIIVTIFASFSFYLTKFLLARILFFWFSNFQVI